MSVFLNGAFAMGLATAGLVFLAAWRDSGDGLFRAFAAAFFLLALERLPLALFGKMEEAGSLVYVLRLLAFTILLFAMRRRKIGGNVVPFSRRR